MMEAVSLAKDERLRGITLAARPGEVLCIIGPNGAGKSTLLKLLSGESRPTAGAVLLNARPIVSFTPEARARTLAVLPQISTLSAGFTGLEVVQMGRSSSALSATIARQALAALDASHLEAKLYPLLSGGERQSVQLARVLTQIWDAPEANLLLDEPIANLDPAQQHRMLSVARNFARNGAAVLIVLHDLNLAAEYADRLAVLKSGSLIAHGTPAQVLTPQSIWEAFGFRATVVRHPGRAAPFVFSK